MPINRIFRAIVYIAPWLILMGCADQEPILIGFSVELTGPRSELGVAARDGAQLAVDEINQRGGVNGRPIKLIIKDDKGDPEIARQVDKQLIDQGVVAIIGHTTSGQTAAVLDQINEAKVVLLSPTSSSTLFSGRADYFFRVMPGNELMGTSIANRIYNKHGVQQLTGVYDSGNQAFSGTLWEAVKTEFESLGGDASQVFTFTGGQTDLEDLMLQVSATQPEALIFIASAVDTALMAQYIRQDHPEILLFSSTWAQTDELLEKGGHAVEGLEMSAVYNPQHPSKTYQEFARRFENRYNRQPGLATSHAYEAVLVLAHALEQTNGQAKNLPQALTAINNLQGVQGTISIDEYGDVIREVYIVQVKDGQFEVIDTIIPK